MQLEQTIKDFHDYMKGKLESIEKISSEKDETLFKKIIYFSFLESLAKATYPEDSVKQRFIKFLNEFTNWKEGSYYCPMHLKKETSLSSDILEDCENKINSIFNGHNRTYSTIESFAINSSEFSPEKDNHKFSYLLYKARNALVHQFQASIEWTESLERRGIESPFYQVTGTGGAIFEPTNRHIEIIFPNIFLKNLAKEGLSNFINYCIKEQINPFPRYYFERKIEVT
jgi:hypothetical protein